MTNILFALEMVIHLLKTSGYLILACWLIMFINVTDILSGNAGNTVVINFYNALDNNIVKITAGVAILEVVAHLLNFPHIVSSHFEKSRKRSEKKTEKLKREMETKLKYGE